MSSGSIIKITMYLYILLQSMLVTVFCASLSGDHPRNVVATIEVSNGMGWGAWGHADFCFPDTYAAGFQTKVEAPVGRGDDTALNAIKLQCVSTQDFSNAHTIESSAGPWGAWHGTESCMSLPCDGCQFFLSRFQLRVEGNQGGGIFGGDDTAANNINFECRTLSGGLKYTIDGTGGTWGGWGGWSSECPHGSAICGIQTRLERPRGNGDDTALNNVKFFCCDD